MPYSLIITLIALVFIFLIVGYILRKQGAQVFLGYGVPFVPTGDYKIIGLLENIEIEPGQKFLDLGCGDGKVLVAIKQKFPEVECTGIEAAPYPFSQAVKKQKQNGGEYQLIKGDFFERDFSEYNVIYSFLMSYLMKKIWKKIKAECKPGTLFYSNAFEIKGEKIYKKITLKAGNYIYVYKV